MFLIDKNKRIQNIRLASFKKSSRKKFFSNSNFKYNKHKKKIFMFKQQKGFKKRRMNKLVVFVPSFFFQSVLKVKMLRKNKHKRIFKKKISKLKHFYYLKVLKLKASIRKHYVQLYHYWFFSFMFKLRRSKLYKWKNDNAFFKKKHTLKFYNFSRLSGLFFYRKIRKFGSKNRFRLKKQFIKKFFFFFYKRLKLQNFCKIKGLSLRRLFLFYKKKKFIFTKNKFFYSATFLFRVLKKNKVTHQFLHFIKFFFRFIKIRQLRKKTRAVLRFRSRKINRRIHGLAGVRVLFRKKHRTFVKRTLPYVFVTKKKNYQEKKKRVRFPNKVYLYFNKKKKHFQTFKFSIRFLKKSLFKEKFSRRNWFLSKIWQFRLKTNRIRLRKQILSSKICLYSNLVQKVSSFYFTFNTILVTFLLKDKGRLPQSFRIFFYNFQIFELDKVLLYTFNYFANISMQHFFEFYKEKTARTGFSIPLEKYKVYTNFCKTRASEFLLVFLQNKKKLTLDFFSFNLRVLQKHIRKKRIEFFIKKKDIIGIKESAQRKISPKKTFKHWYRFFFWRNWRRRFTPLLFKTGQALKSFELYQHLLVLARNLKFYARTSLQLGGVLRSTLSFSSKRLGFSFLNCWIFRTLGKRLRFSYKYKRKRRFKQTLLQKKLKKKIKLLSKLIKKVSKPKFKVFSKHKRKFFRRKFYRFRRKPILYKFNPREKLFRVWKRKNQNLFRRYFSLQGVLPLLRVYKFVWSQKNIKILLKGSKPKGFGRLTNRFQKKNYNTFKPWYLSWWSHFFSKKKQKNFNILNSLPTVIKLSVSIKITLNNVFVAMVDEFGNPLISWSSGSVGFKGPTKKTTTAVDTLLEEIFLFVNRVKSEVLNILFTSTPSSFLSKRFLGSFIQPSVVVNSVSFCGNLPHNGMRTKRQKRR